ncbi:uncharacterized protein [Spinacia oleracea]|uniref:Uncharacterized protein n=1 Tax=Spinacia oleracea TaxID=3562 RepID=A0ABM3QPB9_SPIOL|nr:uncharacterized protein LOC110793802 [Spinacia oleracea]
MRKAQNKKTKKKPIPLFSNSRETNLTQNPFLPLFHVKRKTQTLLPHCRFSLLPSRPSLSQSPPPPPDLLATGNQNLVVLPRRQPNLDHHRSLRCRVTSPTTSNHRAQHQCRRPVPPLPHSDRRPLFLSFLAENSLWATFEFVKVAYQFVYTSL